MDKSSPEWLEKQREYGRAAYWRKRNDPEKWEAHKAQGRVKWAAKKETELEQQRAWRKNNPDKVREYKKRYYHKNIAKTKSANRAHYLKRREQQLASQKKKRDDNIELYRENQRKRRQSNIEQRREKERAYRYKNRPSTMMSTCRRAAVTKSIPCDLDHAWFRVRLQAGVCEMSGLPFDLDRRSNLGGRNPNAPSIDRIDPKGGYTKSNCRMVLWWLNRSLINLGDEYALSVFRAIFIKRGEMLSPIDAKMAA